MANKENTIYIRVSNEELIMLDRMMVDDEYEFRTAFIRRLIRQEWSRRNSLAEPTIPVVATGTGNRYNQDDIHTINK